MYVSLFSAMHIATMLAVPTLIAVLMMRSGVGRSGGSAGLVLFVAAGTCVAWYLLSTMTLWALDQTAINYAPYSVHGPQTLLLVFVMACCTFAFVTVNICRAERASVVGLHRMAQFAPVFLLLASGAYITSNVPAFGWDALDYWVMLSRDFIQNSSLAVQGGDSYFHNRNNFRHPLTLSVLTSFWPAVSMSVSGSSTPMIDWYVVYVAGAVVVAGIVYYQTQSFQLTILFFYVILGIPLSENHGLIAGYSEIWLGALAVITVGGYALGILNQDYRLKLAGFLAAASMFWVRNTGVIFFAGFIFTIFLVFIKKRGNATTLSYLATLAIVVVLLVSMEPKVTIFGQTMGVFLSPKPSLQLGHYRIDLVFNDAVDVLNNFYFAFFVNLTFSVTCITWLVCTLSHMRGLRRKKCRTSEEDEAELFLRLAIFSQIAILISFQIFTDRGFVFANVDNDTMGSRSFLFVASMMWVYIGYSLKTAVVDRVNLRKLGPESLG